jgi:hypothetical protein
LLSSQRGASCNIKLLQVFKGDTNPPANLDKFLLICLYPKFKAHSSTEGGIEMREGGGQRAGRQFWDGRPRFWDSVPMLSPRG